MNLYIILYKLQWAKVRSRDLLLRWFSACYDYEFTYFLDRLSATYKANFYPDSFTPIHIFKEAIPTTIMNFILNGFNKGSPCKQTHQEVSRMTGETP